MLIQMIIDKDPYIPEIAEKQTLQKLDKLGWLMNSYEVPDFLRLLSTQSTSNPKKIIFRIGFAPLG
jgi:hypothetical protein